MHMKDSSKSVETRTGHGSGSGVDGIASTSCVPWYPRFDRAGHDGREGGKR